MLSEPERELLAGFKLRSRQKREVWDAYLENPAGLLETAARAREQGARGGTSGAGLLLVMIRRGDHLERPVLDGRRVTGYRFQRGSHSGTYFRDPFGTDPLPYGFGS